MFSEAKPPGCPPLPLALKMPCGTAQLVAPGASSTFCFNHLSMYEPVR